MMSKVICCHKSPVAHHFHEARHFVSQLSFCAIQISCRGDDMEKKNLIWKENFEMQIKCGSQN